MKDTQNAVRFQENLNVQIENQTQNTDKQQENVILKTHNMNSIPSPNQSKLERELLHLQDGIIHRHQSKQDDQNENYDVKHNQQSKNSLKSNQKSSQKNISSKNSLESNQNLNYDLQFLARLFRHGEDNDQRWYYPILTFLHFFTFQFLHPFAIIYNLRQKYKLKKHRTKSSFKKMFALYGFQTYLMYSSILLWLGSINYLYLIITKPIKNEDQDFIMSEYNLIILYYVVVCISLAILGSQIYKNNIFTLYLFSKFTNDTFNNLKKCMKQLYISNHDFMFQFIEFPNEDENKLKQAQKIKKVFKLNNLLSQYHSGLDFCEKIIYYSKQKNISSKCVLVRSILLTLVIYFKAFLPGITRYYSNKDFIVYSFYFTIIPYLCIGNIIGFLCRTLNGLQDLNFIYDYNNAISALISYDSYLKLKPKHKINTPSFNPVDIKSIKTWSQMRRLLNEVKKEETIPIDNCSLFLFIYLALVIIAVFLDKFLSTVIIVSFTGSKYIVPYYSVDVLLISCLFSYRVYRQTKINEQYKGQYKLLQQLKNILIKFFIYRNSYEEKDNIIFLDKDIQWFFYSKLNENYQKLLKTRRLGEMLKTQYIKEKNFSDHYNKLCEQVLKEKNKDEKKVDYEYNVQVINIIASIQNEIQMEILQTPMKFMGLLPSNYYLLWTFFSFIGTFIYLSFYLYFIYE